MSGEILGEQYIFKGVKEIHTESLTPKREGKVILIVGEPGSGKSVFMHQLYNELKDGDIYLTAIDAAFLDENDSPEKVFNLFETSELRGKTKVLILDSLDVLAYSRRKELNQWLNYVDKLKKIENSTIVCASRSFEAEHLYPMNKQEWSQKHFMEPLPEKFIKKVFQKLAYGFEDISNRLELFKSPLYLKIAANIIENGGDIKDISTLQGLYARLCEVLDISPRESEILISIAESMIRNRTTYLAYSLINIELHEEVKSLEKSGIMGFIQIDDKNQRLSFFHQTLIDYFSALKVLNEGITIKDFVLRNDQSLFIRPVIRHILFFLRIQSENALFKQLNEVFFDKNQTKRIEFMTESEQIPLRMHVKTAIITNLASWKNPTKKEGEFIKYLFRQAEYGQTMMVEFFKGQPGPEWFDVLKDIYIGPLLKETDSSNIEYRVTLSFLERILPEKTSEVLNICFMLLEQKDDRHLEFYFYSIAEKLYKLELETQLIEKYENLLEEIVRRKIIKINHSISKVCRMLSKYTPTKGLTLFIEALLMELEEKDERYLSSSESLNQMFDQVIPSLFKIIPFQVLDILIDFFENIFSRENSSETTLSDSPDIFLYSRFSTRYDLDAVYEWFKNRILDYCSNSNDEAEALIRRLDHSKWETQRQLSMLCKIRNASIFKTEIQTFVERILAGDLSDKSMYKQSELFLRALEVVFLFISKQEKQKITQAIINLKFDDSMLIRVWIWKPLHHISKHFRSKAIEEKIKYLREKYEFENNYKYTPPIVSSGVQSPRSPISKEKLETFESSALYDFLVEKRELNSEWEMEEDIFYGGVESIAEEVAPLLANNLERYGDLVDKLAEDEKNNIYIRRLFWVLSDKGVEEDKFDFFVDLILKVYEREELQLGILRFLEKSVAIIQENQLRRLRGVFIYLSEVSDPKGDKFFEYRKQGYSNDAISEGINSTRGSLAQLCIQILQRFNEGFLIEILDKLSKDKTISVRAALVWYLPYSIGVLGWEKSFKLFLNAFEKRPEEYSKLIPNFLRYVPKENIDDLEEILEKMWHKRDSYLGKAYAELVTILYFRELYPAKKLIEIMDDAKLIVKGKERSFWLLAGQLEFKGNVDKILEIISPLLEFEHMEDMNWGYVFLKARPEDFLKFEPIISKIIKKRSKLMGKILYKMLEYLEKSLLEAPLQVFDLLENIILGVEENILDIADYAWNSSTAPLNIINTVFECFPEQENRGLKVLDKLIEFRWGGVDDYLYSLDRI